MKNFASILASIVFLTLTDSTLFSQWTTKMTANNTPIWLDGSLQRKLELTRDQRREMFELALKHEEK